MLAAKSSIICGSEEADMMLLLQIAKWLASNHWEQLSQQLQDALDVVRYIWYSINNTGRRGGQTVHEILLVSRKLNAANPRDKVFGMLGLLDPEHANHKLLEPDYTKRVPEVFRDAVRHHVAYGPYFYPLQIFGEISHREVSELVTPSNTYWPSWVPRFDRLYDFTLDATNLRAHGDPGDLGVNWLASSYSTTREHTEPEILVLLGSELCSVRQVSLPYRPDYAADDLETQHQWSSWYEDVARMVQVHDISQATLARTLVVDTDQSTREMFEAPYAGLVALLQYAQNEEVIVPYYPLLNSDVDELTVQASQYFHSATRFSEDRKFALMSNGTIGLVPHLTEATDVVVMMRGGYMPLVLRPLGEEYLMLGQCYVDGWMFWQEHGDEMRRMMRHPELKTFRIR